MADDLKARYEKISRSGPLKRVYVDLPVHAHEQLAEIAAGNGIPMKAQLTILIDDAVSKPRSKKRITKRKIAKRKTRKKVTKRSKKRGKKKANNKR